MNFREPKEENNLFFTCSLIEYIARRTQNIKRHVVNTLGLDRIEKIYNLADVYHSENIDKVIDDFVSESSLEKGEYDYKSGCKYKIPSEFEIGRVYQKLIIDISNYRNQDFIAVIFEVFNSWITEKIDDYNSSFYYSNSDYIFACYLEGEVLEY